MIEASRRSLLVGLGAIIAAPAIVRASSLMKVRMFNEADWERLTKIDITPRHIHWDHLTREDSWFLCRDDFRQFKDSVAFEVLNR